MAPPTLRECAAILGRVDASLRGWTPTDDTARADALDGLEVLRTLVATEAPPPRFNEFYASPIDASEAVALVRDTLVSATGPGYRRDLSPADGAAVRAARGA